MESVCKLYRALIADDERAELEGLSSLIQKAGLPFCVTLCGDGAKAYAALQEEHFDLLISDIVMPQMDGLTLCTHARELNNKIVTVISSAYSDFKYTQAAIRIGVDDYLLKPIVVDSFYQTMARMLDLIRLRSDGESAAAGNPLEDNANQLIPAVKALIQEHYGEDISLEWIASKMYLSPSYLSSLFKRRTGRTIMQYITLFRMRRACHLLRKTNMKIVQVCHEAGYTNPSYFCFLFKKYFGITPNQYREGESADVLEKIRKLLEME